MKPQSEKRNNFIAFALSANERRAVEVLAKQRRTSLSEVVRNALWSELRGAGLLDSSPTTNK